MGDPHPEITAGSLAQDCLNLGAELVDAVGCRKAAEAERKAALADFDAVVTQWKARLAPVKDLEEALRLELLALVEAVEAAQQHMLGLAVHDPSLAAKVPSVPKIPGVAFMWKDVVEIADPALIPAAYLAPDEAKIKAAALAGVPVPGVVKVQRRGVVVR
jgi:hypothetical protein